jgi:hypothetical protein
MVRRDYGAAVAAASTEQVDAWWSQHCRIEAGYGSNEAAASAKPRNIRRSPGISWKPQRS